MTSYNINLLGDAGVGKSTWIKKIKTNVFVNKYIATVGCSVNTFDIKTNYGKIILNLCDYAGQEKYSDRTRILKTDATILMFDLSNKCSYNNLQFWYNKCQAETECIFVVGNACDCSDIITAPTFHEKYNLPYLSLSAKTMPYIDLLTPILRNLTGQDDLVIME